jgi:hypothetical protein
MEIIVVLIGITIIIGVPAMILYVIRKTKYPWVKAVLLLLAVGAVTWYMTYRYKYMPHEDKKIHGWPVPSLIFQRSTSDGRWLDYVGPNVILAYPINYVFYLSIPTLLLTVYTLILNKLPKHRLKGDGVGRADGP